MVTERKAKRKAGTSVKITEAAMRTFRAAAKREKRTIVAVIERAAEQYRSDAA